MKEGCIGRGNNVEKQAICKQNQAFNDAFILELKATGCITFFSLDVIWKSLGTTPPLHMHHYTNYFSN